MTSPLAQAARVFGYAFIPLVLLCAAGMLLDPSAAMLDRGMVIAGSIFLIYWIGEPLLRHPVAGAPSALMPSEAQMPARDQPRAMVPFDVTEAEWVRGKLLYRGVNTVMGVGRRIALALPVVFLPYVLLIIRRLPADDVLPHPLGAGAAILALSIAYVLIDNFYRAPLQAARTYRENRDRWWPAELAWDAEAIFLKNPQERLHYPLAECRAWKDDAALILLHSGDHRYWCLPKRTLDVAGRLPDFERLLQDHVPKIASYQVVYR